MALLPNEDRLNVDETGHKDNGKRLWTWCFRASLYTVYKISPSRRLRACCWDVLGEELNGVLGCDYFSAYRKYMRLNENVVVPVLPGPLHSRCEVLGHASQREKPGAW